MNYLEKIKTVRENILLWGAKNGSDFHYPITGFCIENEITDETRTTVTAEEQREIIRYLARRKFLNVLKETSGGGSFHIKILPKTNPTIKLKTLELIARELKDYYTGTEITALLKQCGVDEKLIIYPETKWVIFYNVFEELSISKDKKAEELLLKILGEAVHPLNLGGDERKSEIIVEKFKGYLRYDDFLIEKTDKEYVVISKNEKEKRRQYMEAVIEEMQQQEPDDDWEEDIPRQVDVATLTEAKDKIKAIRDSHQTYIDVIELFCRDTKKPTKELNDAYVFLAKKIQRNIKELKLEHYHIPFYKPFKEDLYRAEIEWNGNEVKRQIVLGPKLSWDTIRPSLYAVHSEITSLCNIADEDTEMTDDEKKLEEINNLISKQRTPKVIQSKPEKVTKIEITNMPDLNIRNVEESTITKNKKKISLPKFPATDWGKVEIRFIDKQTVYIKAGKNTATSDYESLGFCNDKNKKPNSAWCLLFEIAKNGGETPVIKSPVSDKIKQQKRVISDRLKTIFKNDTDPFYDFTETNTYKCKIKLIPPTEEKEGDALGVGEYLNETMTSEYGSV